MQGTMPGARRRGRPRTAWIDNVKTWTGLSVEQSVRMTEDRDKWRTYDHCGPTLGSRTAKDQNRTAQQQRQHCVIKRVVRQCFYVPCFQCFVIAQAYCRYDFKFPRYMNLLMQRVYYRISYDFSFDDAASIRFGCTVRSFDPRSVRY